MTDDTDAVLAAGLWGDTFGYGVSPSDFTESASNWIVRLARSVRETQRDISILAGRSVPDAAATKKLLEQLPKVGGVDEPDSHHLLGEAIAASGAVTPERWKLGSIAYRLAGTVDRERR